MELLSESIANCRDIVWGRRFGSSNGPVRLVGKPEVLWRYLAQRATHLLDANCCSLVRITMSGLPNTQQRCKPGIDCSGHLAGHHFVVFTEDGASFSVPDFDDASPEGIEILAGNFAGESTTISGG